MNKVFKVINPNFFSCLSSPNKEIYLDCLFIIYEQLDSVEDSFQAEREKIVLKLQDYFDENHLDVFEFESEKEEVRTSRAKANAVINKLKDTGWIGEEELGNYKTSINLFSHSIRFLELLKSLDFKNSIDNLNDDLSQNDEIPFGIDMYNSEYTGDIYAIYLLLKGFEINQGINVLEQVYIKTKIIINKLKSLSSNIYNYYYNITQGKQNQELEELLENLLIDYKKNFFDNQYYNLKTTDSLSRFKILIIKLLNDIYNNDQYMDSLSTQLQQIKNVNDFNKAYEVVENSIRFIINSFNSFEQITQTIDKKNEQYITATSQKIIFLTNRSNDLEGIFNRIFDSILKESDENKEYNHLFNLTFAKNLDENSMYTQRVYRKDPNPEPIDLFFEPSELEKQKALNNFTKNTIYNKKSINDFVNELLKNVDTYQAKDISIKDNEDFVKLILIFIYSRSSNMCYIIEQTDERVNINNIYFNNFIIKRRGKVNV